MRAFLVGPVGTARDLKAWLKSKDFRPETDEVIGVDGGVKLCKQAGVYVTFAIGDWDSLGRTPEIPHKSLPKKKDESDLWHALRAGLKRGANEFVCLGVFEGQADQHVATLLDLLAFSAHPEVARISGVSNAARYFFVSHRTRFKTKVGQPVSVFAFRKAEGVTLSGFKYELNDARLEPSSRGLSNRAKKSVCEVSLRQGQLLIIMPSGNGKSKRLTRPAR